jgi:hypothetical protein
MSLQFFLQGEEAEAKLAQVEAIDIVVVDGVGAVVPSVGFVLAKLNAVDGFELGGFLMGEQGCVVHAEVLGVAVILLLLLLYFFDSLFLGIFLNYFLGQLLDALVGDPLVVPSVERLVVDVVFVGGLILFSCGIIIYIIEWKKKKKNFLEGGNYL